MCPRHLSHDELHRLAGGVVGLAVSILCGCVLKTEPVLSADAASDPSDAALADSAAAIDGIAPDGQAAADADPCPPHAIVAAIASADDGNGPGNAIDGDLDTRWSAAGVGQWIAFDLGQSVEVASLAIAWYRGDERSAIFAIESSPDASSWSEVFSGSSSGSSLDLETYSFTAHGARHVRIVGQGNDVSDWNSITEIEIYSGCD